MNVQKQTRTLELYTPHAGQLRLHQSLKRYRVGVWGRQGGKSTWALNELLSQAWEKPGTRYWFVSPVSSQSLDMYRRMVGMLWPVRDILLKKNQTERRIKLINHSEIHFVSGEVGENLRGPALHGCVIDEVREQHPNLFPMIIRPMLTTTKGWCAFISTPNGFDHFYDLYEMARADEEWDTFHAPSTINPLFDQAELEAAKKSMTDAQFAQEIMAEFRDLTAGRAYLTFSTQDQGNLVDMCPFYDARFHPHLSVVLGCDFNLSPMHWTLGQTRADEWYWFEEIHLENSHTPEAALELVARIQAMKVEGYKAEPNVIICGDATSKAGQRAAAGQSDYDILKAVLRAHGITFRDDTPESNPPVKDRVNAVNAKLMDATGARHMWFHVTGVPETRKDFERVVWKKGANATLDEGPLRERTHASDSVGYPVFHMTPVKGVRDVGRVRVIHRSF